MAGRFNHEYLKPAVVNRSGSSVSNGSRKVLVSPYPSQMGSTPGNPQGQKGILGDYTTFATRNPTMMDTPSGIPLVPKEIYDGQETNGNLPTMVSQPPHGNVQGYSGIFNFDGSSATLIPETNGVIINNVPNHSRGNNIPRVVSLPKGPNIHGGVLRLNSAGLMQNQEFFTQNDNFHSLPQLQKIANTEFLGTMHGNESHHDIVPSIMPSQESYNAQPIGIKSGSFYLPYHPQQQLSPPTYVQNTGVQIPRSVHSQPYIELQNQPQSRIVGGPVRDNRFGIYHLMNVKKNPALRYLSMGIDLTKLGVDVTSKEPFISDKFASPWSDEPVKEEPVFSIPNCYISNQIQPLKECHFSKLPDHTLVYIFYSMPKDKAQLYAANELCNRGWLYHKDLHMWLKRVPNKEPLTKAPTYEKSDYFCFDPDKWAMILKENFVLHYEMIEKRPVLPQQ